MENILDRATERHFLYQLDDGHRVVFNFFQTNLGDALGPEWSHAHDASPVRFGPCLNADDLYIDVEPPQDLETCGREISEHEAKRLTGFYLPARRALDHALVTLSRVGSDDEEYSLAQSARMFLEAIFSDSPKVASSTREG